MCFLNPKFDAFTAESCLSQVIVHIANIKIDFVIGRWSYSFLLFYKRHDLDTDILIL